MGLFDWFSNRKLIEGDVVDLRERYRVDERSAYDGVPTVYYDVLNHENKEKVGTIDLRLTVEGDMFYYGHIGYNILKNFRGNNYAYHACKVLFKVAKKELAWYSPRLVCATST
ncbi:MAG: hypothetical protein II042_03175 [Erysipelotrichaceae bacterium]|nr:hypothetical protein [Erysipelotrichaceae bacterium]